MIAVDLGAIIETTQNMQTWPSNVWNIYVMSRKYQRVKVDLVVIIVQSLQWNVYGSSGSRVGPMRSVNYLGYSLALPERSSSGNFFTCQFDPPERRSKRGYSLSNEDIHPGN